jgi:hypothetical protein
MLGYVGKKADGRYAPFLWNSSLPLQDVELSDDVFLVQREVAEAYKATEIKTTEVPGGAPIAVIPGAPRLPLGGGEIQKPAAVASGGSGVPSTTNVRRLVWSGDVPHQKWMNFYTKVLSRFASTAGLRVTLRVEVSPPEGVSPQHVEETRLALRELGLKDSVDRD